MTATTVPRLAIEYDPALVPKGGQEVLGSPGAPVKGTTLEPAGHKFHAAALLAAGITKLRLDGEPEPEAKKRALTPLEQIDTSRWENCGTVMRNTKAEKKAGKSELDKYALLGLIEERHTATEKMIKDAYRDACLLFHPDKCGATMMDEDDKLAAEERFKAIQEAYDCLSDPAKRRVYDSTDHFNDSLPSSAADDADFFKSFGAAFVRQSRWAVVTPAPELGDADTDIKEVQSFYDYWFGYKSWREFPDEEENDLESAECREHKRFMERQNAKLREKNKKKEDKRLMNWVETAYKLDPRIIAMKQREKDEKEAKKQAKHAERNKEKWEKEEKERLEKERLEAEAQAAKAGKEGDKKEKEKQKKALQKERKRLRTLVGELRERLGATALLPSEENVESLCSELKIDALKELCDKAEAPGLTADAAVELFNAVLTSIGQGEMSAEDAPPASPAPPAAPKAAEPAAAAKANKAAAAEAAEAEEDVGADWTEEEVRLLGKALKKYPKGVVRRWEAIAAFLGGRTPEEVIKVSKAKFTVDGAEAKPSGDAYANFVKDKAKHASNKQREIESDASSRAESFSDVDVKLTGAAAEAAGMAATAAEEWTPVSEQALVKAVKAFPKGCAPSEKERWMQIAAAVPGKSPAQCVKHLPLMLERMRANKAKA